MSNPSQLGAICYGAESSFGETTTTASTLRLPHLGTADTSGLVHNKMESERLRQYLNACPGYVLGTMGGTVKTKTYLTGHGSTTSGATTATPYETWLALFWGNGVVSASAGTTFTGGTATAPTTTASGTFAAGSIGWAGALGDGRANGQPFAVGTHVTTTLTPLTALAAAPSNGDVCYSGYNFYLPETSYSCTSQRLLLQSANVEYLCHGCHPTAVSITGLSPGELPMIEITWQVAWWEYRTDTFPSTVTNNTDNPAATAAGSLFVNDVGTATRSTRTTARKFSINIELGMVTLRGFGGVNQYQDIVGCRRTPSKISCSWTEDADAATTTPVIPGYGTSTTNKHILWGNGGPAGQRVAIYLPNVVSKVVAIQKNENGINSFTYEGHADVGSTTTNDLTLSALRLAFG
jgi:hypothetical protein